jgi:hypothetical protein
MSLAMKLKGNLGSADTGRGISPNIWGDCPWDSIVNGTIPGVAFHDDFMDFPLIGTQTTEIAHGRYKVFAHTGCAVTPVSAVNSVELGKGILDFSLDTDGDSASLAESYPGLYLTSTAKKLWFEGRLAFSPITTNGIGWFLGLAETELWTLAAGVPFNAGDAITNSAAAIGFRKEEDGLGVIDTVYSDRATSFTNIGDADTGVDAAYEFIKLGMMFDPNAIAAKRIRFFANNLELATPLSATALTALTNLDANALGLLFAVVADSAGTSGHVYVDWWRYAQLG